VGWILSFVSLLTSGLEITLLAECPLDRGKIKNRGDNSSNTFTHTPRPLMTPDEVMRMPNNKQLIFIKGLKPIRCDRPNYYDHRTWSERSKMPPPKEVDFL
jgi:type IV secretory pathway TraG/TraD family ATPase VirD4